MYNPIVNAISELTSTEAQTWYKDQAFNAALQFGAALRSDANWDRHHRATISLSIAAVEGAVSTAETVYKLAQITLGLWAWLQRQDHEEIEEYQLALPATKIAGLLPSAKEPATATEPVKAKTVIAKAIAHVQPKQMGVSELRKLCSKHGIAKASRLTKAAAIDALIEKGLVYC